MQKKKKKVSLQAPKPHPVRKYYKRAGHTGFLWQRSLGGEPSGDLLAGMLLGH